MGVRPINKASILGIFNGSVSEYNPNNMAPMVYGWFVVQSSPLNFLN